MLDTFGFRQIQVQLRSPDKSKFSKLLEKGLTRIPLQVGLIGCGRLGSHLVNCLLTFGELQPNEVMISTRRPEILSMFDQFVAFWCICVLFIDIGPSYPVSPMAFVIDNTDSSLLSCNVALF